MVLRGGVLIMKLNQKKLEANLIKLSEKMATMSPEELEAINKAEIRVNDLYMAIELATGVNIMDGVVEDE